MEKDSRLIIDKELGVIDKIVPKIISDNSEVVPYQAENGDDVENDYKYQRDNFYNLVEKGSTAIEGILELKNVTNALFVGSTTELQKMLKDKIEDGSN